MLHSRNSTNGATKELVTASGLMIRQSFVWKRIKRFMMYWLKTKLPSEFSVHHMNGNRLDALKENLCVVLNSTHASEHNKGKEVSDKVKERLIEFNHSRKNTRQTNRRADVKYYDVKRLHDKGYSLNKIAKELDCDWTTVRARLQDIFDNPELLKGGVC